MSFKHTIKVANPSSDERSDYVEVDLESAGVPPDLYDKTLRLVRNWRTGSSEEAFQIDYPFGREAGYRTLTFFSRNTPPGDTDYTRHTAEFSLEAGNPHNFADSVNPHLLRVEHYPTPGVGEVPWNPEKRYVGVKLLNGGAPTQQDQVSSDGLQVYFSLVPRPEVNAPLNYSGAATSVLHHRAWRGGPPEALAPVLFRPHSAEKRWGQLTHIDMAALPWERRSYQLESMLGEPGKESDYTLVWSNTGPLRATVTLKSKPIHVRYGGMPFFQPNERELTCHLYRIISVYPNQEFYTEKLILRPDEQRGAGKDRISIAFRAYYCSHLDYPAGFPLTLARFEDTPDYFCVWRSFAGQHRGYAFASEMHVRELRVTGSQISWRLARGHEHRCVHLFPFHGYPEEGFDPFHEVGHAWYEWLYKPLLAIPPNRYVPS